MVKRAYCLVMLMMLAQPAAATQMVNLANSARAVASANCLAEDPACTIDGIAGAQSTSDMESSDTGSRDRGVWVRSYLHPRYLHEGVL